MLGWFIFNPRARQLNISSAQYRRFCSLFDPDYYLMTQPDVAKARMDPERHYCEFGWREGRNPSEIFNTIWYLQAYEDVARSGINPLIHYVRTGFEDGRETVPRDALTTEWLDMAEANLSLPKAIRDFVRDYKIILRSRLFDSEYYCELYSLKKGDPIEYYLRHGSHERHDPAPFFDSKWYRKTYADVEIGGQDPFLHYILYGYLEGRRASPKELDYRGTCFNKIDHNAVNERSYEVPFSEPPTPIPPPASAEDLRGLANEFDEVFYRRKNSDVDFSEITPIAHYAQFGWREGRDPSPDFSTTGYLHLNPDVREVDMNPLLHFVVQGKSEGRLSRPRQRTPSPADGLSEWRGYAEVQQRGFESLEGAERDVDALSFCVALRGLDLGEVVSKINFGLQEDKVRVSIIIPCLDEELVTVECLKSIEQALPNSFGVEVIVADNASKDLTFGTIARNPTISYVKFEKNLGFGAACNAAAARARGEYLFFLNNDAQIAPGCLEALVDAVAGERVGIVGPKILSFDGSLQEAGCRLNRDGTGTLIGFGRDPRTPRYNYRRCVEHVSGAAVLIERGLFLDFGGFDDVYAPAYCEDADLSLKVRKKGLSIVYEPKAVVAHHLSKTSNASLPENQTKKQRISRNRHTLVSRWRDQLATSQLRTIAFYLPQYHPIPENDLWWGKGFTEWTNVSKTQPNYVGHNQPRVPADLGYYDLRVPQVMEQQAALARRYGVTGFCYYYYWFDGKRLLEQPLERMLASGTPDIAFCLCWANENWTRRWDGQERDILCSQSYSDEGAIEIAKDLTRYFRSDAYIRINGKPLILIYRIKELPNPNRTISIWRNYCRQSGVGEICVAMVESFELSAKPEDPSIYGCDITVEFPAHGMVHDPAISVEKVNFDWTGSVHDYRELAAAFMRRVEPGFPRLRSVLAGWDPAPRHSNRCMILEHATPGAFQAWLEWTYRRTMEQNFGEERIVFVLAWNEWCEGSYIEPDRHFGHAYLQAVQNALEAVESSGGTFVV